MSVHVEPPKKRMRCYDCGERIRATIGQAKAHGWTVWVGGATCKMCYGAPMNEHILQFFAHAHLPPHLAEVSAPFAELAQKIVDTLPLNPERTVALRKLLESKDAAVRARLAKD